MNVKVKKGREGKDRVDLEVLYRFKKRYLGFKETRLKDFSDQSSEIYSFRDYEKKCKTVG